MKSIDPTLVAETPGPRAVDWRLLIDHAHTAAEHMAIDDRLAREGVATVRLFTWPGPAVSLGFRQRAPEWLTRRPDAPQRPELVERPTGGGVAFHGSDLSIAVIVPQDAIGLRALMALVCQQTVRLCGHYGIHALADVDEGGTSKITYCLTESSPYAVYARNRKLAGFALRRYEQSWLVQGSLLVNPLPEELIAHLPADVLKQLQLRAVSLSECAALRPIRLAGIAAEWAALWMAPRDG